MGWENEPLKKQYFNFGGLWCEKNTLKDPSWAHIWNQRCMNFPKITLKTKFPSQMLSQSPKESLPPIWPRSSPDLARFSESVFFNCISDRAVGHISREWFPLNNGFLRLRRRRREWWSSDSSRLCLSVARNQTKPAAGSKSNWRPIVIVQSKQCSQALQQCKDWMGWDMLWVLVLSPL